MYVYVCIYVRVACVDKASKPVHVRVDVCTSVCVCVLETLTISLYYPLLYIIPLLSQNPQIHSSSYLQV